MIEITVLFKYTLIVNVNVNKSVNKYPRLELPLSYYYFLTEFNSNMRTSWPRNHLWSQHFIMNYKPVWNLSHTFIIQAPKHIVCNDFCTQMWSYVMLSYPSPAHDLAPVQGLTSPPGFHLVTPLVALGVTLAVAPVKVSMET